MKRLSSCFFLSLCISTSFANPITTLNPVSISTHALPQFNNNSEPVKKILIAALSLAEKNLGYFYGSADPSKGGMDCSGTIYYLLRQAGIKEPPRSSDLIHQWVLKKGNFFAVNAHQFSSPEFAHLRPGDLLFWSGTYEIKRASPVTHVMIYLGTNKEGKPLMIGASNGRTYQGKKIYGVSVFDFLLPNKLSKSKFLGYSCIPQISCTS